MNPHGHGFEFSSRLAAPAAEVWAHATSMRGVNRELFPLARMTHPRGLSVLDPATLPIGQRAFRSWILAAGIVPIDYDDLTFLELEPGRRFLERSPMLTQREWQHERVIEPAAGGSTITDRVRFVPRVAWLGPVFLAVFRLAFALRHRNLRRIFGGIELP
jgi:ligand-binding SRPBCC domain-containing protein